MALALLEVVNSFGLDRATKLEVVLATWLLGLRRLPLALEKMAARLLELALPMIPPVLLEPLRLLLLLAKWIWVEKGAE